MYLTVLGNGRKDSSTEGTIVLEKQKLKGQDEDYRYVGEVVVDSVYSPEEVGQVFQSLRRDGMICS